MTVSRGIRWTWFTTLIALTLAMFVSPTSAYADPEATDVTVNANALSADDELYNGGFSQVFMSVIVDGQGVWYNSAGTDTGDIFEFTNVPIYDNAEYYVWINPNETDSNGFIALESPETLDDGNEFYPSTGTHWTGLTASPEPVDLEVSLLPTTPGGSICGLVVDTETDSNLSDYRITIRSSTTVDGTDYLFRDTLDQIGSEVYCFDGLPVGYIYEVAYDPWNQDDPTRADAGYSGAAESLNLRASSPDRSLWLYTGIDSTIGQPGSIEYELALVDPDGNPVNGDNLSISYAGNGLNGEASISDSTATLHGLNPGTYTVTVGPAWGGFAAVTTHQTITASDDVSATNSSELTVYAVPANSGTVTGAIVWSAEPDNIGAFTVSLSAISLETPWDLPIDSNNTSTTSTNPGSDGSWSFTGVPAGEYRVDFDGPIDEGTGQAWTTIDPILVTVGDGEDVDTGSQMATLVESSGDTLNVKVKDSRTRVPLEGVQCSAQHWGDIRTGQSLTTDANGIVTFENLFRGYTYDVRCNAQGTHWGVGGRANAVTIQAGVNNYIVPLDIYQTGAHASGRVVDQDGMPIDQIRITAVQGWAYPDCECGDGFGVSDITDGDGNFQLDNFVIGRDVTMEVIDRSGQFAPMTFTYRADSTENVELGDLVMRVGADVTGAVEDQNGDPLEASITLTDVEHGNRISGATDGTGTIQFDGPVPLGDYTVFVSTGWLETGQHEQGFLTPSGDLSLAESNAEVITISDPEPAVTTIPTITSAVGGTINGTATFVDALGNPLSGSRYDARAQFWVQTDSGWDQITYVSGWASSEMGGEYYLSGLPAGNYKVCLSDYYTSINRFDQVCNGGAATLNSAAPIEIGAGETVSDVDVELKFKQPDVPPQPITFEELLPDEYTALEDQISFVGTSDGVTTISVDPDLAGQWVALEVITDPSLAPAIVSAPLLRPGQRLTDSIAPLAAPVLSEWLQVSASGELEIPASTFSGASGGQVMAISSDNIAVGWTDVVVDDSNGGGDNGGGDNGDGGTDSGNNGDVTIDDAIDPVTTDAPTPAPTEVEKSATGGVAVQNASGPYDDVETTQAPIIITAIMIILLAVGLTVAIRRGRARN